MVMAALSRPTTPDSLMTNSLRQATGAIDDLTIALGNISGTSTPEPHDVTTCCCGLEDCETSMAWGAYKAKMQSRLVLSAEVGQALLRRHEAYMRRQEGHDASLSPPLDAAMTDTRSYEPRIMELLKENAALEKRLNQALLNSEVAESSNKAALHELEDARANVARLTAQQARSVGLETRLAIALQEKDDLQQERDSATQRAKLIELRVNALKERCAKLQAQATHLREDLHMQAVHREELSQEVLADARLRLEQLQEHQLGHTGHLESDEVTKVLESLVADNEALKRDNAELRNLLAESREELHTLQEEVEERRADDVSFLRHRHKLSDQSFISSAPLSPTFHVGTAPSPSALHSVFQKSQSRMNRRAVSVERGSRRPYEPLTPETDRRPLSPMEGADSIETSSQYNTTHTAFDLDESSQRAGLMDAPEKSRAQKSLLLLTRSRGVQTDLVWTGGVNLSSPSLLRGFGDHLSAAAPHDAQSESSSMTDSQSSVMSALLERANTLLNRITQADALTLTNRLKRQHLLGADVSHLSRTTVSSVLNDATNLRGQFRAFLEDDRIVTTCTRRDLRGLLKFVKDVFAEMGQLRVTLNDVILDPSVASRVSDMALHPAKASASVSTATDAAGHSAPAWMAPLSKLLGLPGASTSTGEDAATRALSPPVRPGGRGRPRGPVRIVPKREPALSASAMTVNVEFTGAGVGRAVTSTNTYAAHHPGRGGSISALAGQSLVAVAPPPAQDLSRSVMGIFAGAPRPPQEGADPWIVIPRPQRGVTLPAVAEGAGTATIGRATLRRAGRSASRLTRAVDAVIDQDTQEGTQPTLLDRTLRTRGLSDSSIHTTFLAHGEEHEEQEQARADEAARGQPDRQSVLQALSRRVTSFRFGSLYAGASGAGAGGDGAAISRPSTPTNHRASASDEAIPEGARTPRRGGQREKQHQSSPRTIQPSASRLFQRMNSQAWTAAFEAPEEAAPFFGVSPREEATYLHRTREL
ncbi:hypothetical protein CERSUDRAFT_110951 [Gelatoporia subvermispora B]|uniref:Uncharacterized protein n=1 Tax=Ceriporiopsis subvermispora (strain B) TaxID=914234 RepID=M2RPI1_CERS8|nr:hypothetical protein CERSUDRAFT_110951 [Gelatoporia subvermispora B]